jgi:hypothetical protein
MADQTTIPRFSQFISELQEGAADDELTERVSELLQKLWNEAQSRAEADGSITMVLNFKLSNKGSCLAGLGKVDIKFPQPKRDTSLLFVNKRGEIAKSPFTQTKLQFEQDDSEAFGKGKRLPS